MNKKPHQRLAEARRKMIRQVRQIKSHDDLQKVLSRVPETARKQVFETIKPFLRGPEEWGASA